MRQDDVPACSCFGTRGTEHEVVLIIERGDGRVAAAEVKLAADVHHSDLGHLKWPERRIGDDLLDAIAIAIATAAGSDACRHADGIGVVPAVLLTA